MPQISRRYVVVEFGRVPLEAKISLISIVLICTATATTSSLVWEMEMLAIESKMRETRSWPSVLSDLS